MENKARNSRQNSTNTFIMLAIDAQKCERCGGKEKVARNQKMEFVETKFNENDEKESL